MYRDKYSCNKLFVIVKKIGQSMVEIISINSKICNAMYNDFKTILFHRVQC